MKMFKVFQTLCLIAFAPLVFGQKHMFKRNYKVGQSVTYETTISFHSPSPLEIDVTKERFKVTSVSANGDATLQNTTLSQIEKSKRGTKDLTNGMIYSSPVKKDKYGQPLNSAIDNDTFLLNAPVIRRALEDGIAVGETRRFNLKDLDEFTAGAHGTAQLVSIKDGVATIKYKFVRSFSYVFSTTGKEARLGDLYVYGWLRIDMKTGELIKENDEDYAMTYFDPHKVERIYATVVIKRM